MRNYFTNVCSTVLSLILALCIANVPKAGVAGGICFDLHSSNCETGERFIDLLGDAPAHYKTYFYDREAYFADNIFQQYEYLTSILIENLPSEPIKYDYNKAYIDLSNVTIFGQKPLLLELESWGPYVGCCFSDEYSAYFDADSFVMSDAHEAYTKLYFCRTDEVSRSEFAEALSRAEYHSDVPINTNANSDAVIHIQCGRRFLRYNQHTRSIVFDEGVLQ